MGRHQSCNSRPSNLRRWAASGPRSTSSPISFYIEEMAKHGVSDMVRACVPGGGQAGSYDANPIVKSGVCVHEMGFGDGE